MGRKRFHSPCNLCLGMRARAQKAPVNPRITRRDGGGVVRRTDGGGPNPQPGSDRVTYPGCAGLAGPLPGRRRSARVPRSDGLPGECAGAAFRQPRPCSRGQEALYEIPRVGKEAPAQVFPTGWWWDRETHRQAAPRRTGRAAVRRMDLQGSRCRMSTGTQTEPAPWGGRGMAKRVGTPRNRPRDAPATM